MVPLSYALDHLGDRSQTLVRGDLMQKGGPLKFWRSEKGALKKKSCLFYYWNLRLYDFLWGWCLFSLGKGRPWKNNCGSKRGPALKMFQALKTRQNRELRWDLQISSGTKLCTNHLYLKTFLKLKYSILHCNKFETNTYALIALNAPIMRIVYYFSAKWVNVFIF